MTHTLQWVTVAAFLCCCHVVSIRAEPQGNSVLKSLQDAANEAISSPSMPISESEITSAQQFGHSISIAEWLGPMAPVALSPFFGITCLSGMAMFGGEWISQGNPLIGNNSPLHNPAVFWTFLALTILTSVPRFTKVSKPFAQAVDQLESWSGIVTMITLRILMATAGETTEAPEVALAGMLSVSTDVLMMFAAAINIAVINAVKFVFEVLIWLTPIPFLDAVFEVFNKSMCLALMVVYAWSPPVATGINLVIFASATLVFSWVHRRQVYYQTILFDLLSATFVKSPPGTSLTVFPVSAVGTIRPRAKCLLERTSSGWILRHRPWLRKPVSISIDDGQTPAITRGIFANSITFSQPAVQLTFSRLYNSSLAELAANLKATLPDGNELSPLQPA
ncbi:MAG: hypothetical protein R3C17_03990 [Planctomycetaceae bacterium]